MDPTLSRFNKRTEQATALRAHLATLTDKAQRKATMAELARIDMRQAMAEEARRAFLKP